MKQDPDAACGSIMSSPPAVLKPTDSVSFALQSIVKHRLATLPVVDSEGRYLGMMPRSRLVALALPRVLSYENVKFPPRRLLESGFIQESLSDLQARMDAVVNDPVSMHLDTDVPVLSPETLLMSAMFFLHRQRTILPVVKDGKLLGIVSIWDVLARVGRIG